MGRLKSWKKIRWDVILFGVGVMLLVICAGLQYQFQQDKKHYEESVMRLEEMKEYSRKRTNQQTEECLETFEDENTDGETISYQRLFDANEDMVGWLRIPGTQIDYPVVQTMEEEEYYLYRNFFGEKDNNGTLILDTDSNLEKSSNNLIIHGHNMRSGAMFGTLTDFEDETYAKEHGVIEFYTEEEERTYEIVAVFRSKVYDLQEKTFKYYQFFEAKNQEEFDDFYENIKKLSEFDTGVTAEFGDEFITLSTCAYHMTNGRLVVVGKRIEV